jgi:integrase/recombinase XerD
MAQARTLDEVQINRVQRYLRTRCNSTRDSTIFTFAFNTGLKAKELAALCVRDAEVAVSPYPLQC